MKISQVNPDQVDTLLSEASEEKIEQSKESKASKIIPEYMEPQVIRFDLAKNKGTAEFRYPRAIDLQMAEKKTGRLVTPSLPVEYYRNLAEICCIKWGNYEKIPSEDTIRAVDDENMIEAMIKTLSEASDNVANVSDYIETIDNPSNPDFDACKIVLTDGSEVCFKEPSQKDNRERERSDTNTEGNLKVLAALCFRWNNEKLGIAEYRAKFTNLGVEDFYRISNVFSFFR